MTNNNNYLNNEQVDELIDMTDKQIATPPKESTQEQKYYIKLKLPDILSDERKFINRVTNTDNGHVEYTLSDQLYYTHRGVSWEPQFTIKEFEEIIPKKYRDSFELIPINEASKSEY